jgi:CDP-diacylglycerol---glycerol-3-phosphate 3-phosphatidyltransferase
MTPNQITAARMMTAFISVLLFVLRPGDLPAGIVAVALTICAIALDGLDGYVARRRGLATPLGAQFDILGDRVVENLYLTFFATSGSISLWIPVLFFVRGAITDLIRGAAARAGRVGFGKSGMLETRWGHTLVASRASRFLYAGLKCLLFVCLGANLAITRHGSPFLSTMAQRWFEVATQILVGAAVTMCIIRFLPVAWEGRRYFLDLQGPPLGQSRPAVLAVIRSRGAETGAIHQ